MLHYPMSRQPFASEDIERCHVVFTPEMKYETYFCIYHLIVRDMFVNGPMNMTTNNTKTCLAVFVYENNKVVQIRIQVGAVATQVGFGSCAVGTYAGLYNRSSYIWEWFCVWG